MSSSSFKKLLFVIAAMLLCIGSQVSLFMGGGFFTRAVRTKSILPQVPVTMTATTITPTQTVIKQEQAAHFEAGMIFPQWTQNSYGFSDTVWQQGLHDIQAQTGARWIELTILLNQVSPTSTHVGTGQSTASVNAVASGIITARTLGYHVFIVPLMGVDVAGTWAASIHFSTYQEEQEWFDSYWQVLRPYYVAAAQAGADQVSIGTELEWLQQNAPDTLWNTLIARVHSVFQGKLTYNMNWSSLYLVHPAWLTNNQLNIIGVSEYIPLVNSPVRVNPAEIIPLWRDNIKSFLDKLAIELGKPLIISEIGYRNSADTLYHPWFPMSTISPPDPTEQAAACNAALVNIFHDSHIVGIFFWGWDGVQEYKLSGQPALAVLHKWYTSLQS